MNQHDESIQIYLAATPFLDYSNPQVSAYARSLVSGISTPVEKAIRLYYGVRDDILYDPYNVRSDVDYLRASHTLEVKRGYCVSKAVLLAAVCRAAGIPARLGFADVRNHLTTPRLKETMGTDLFAYHGYVELFVNNRWVKATPAFNRSLCERFGVHPLEFDGVNDSLFQPYATNGQKHMEYVRDHGVHADVPLDDIIESFRRHYPHLAVNEALSNDGDFEKEARPME